MGCDLVKYRQDPLTITLSVHSKSLFDSTCGNLAIQLAFVEMKGLLSSLSS
jgi:hypothetical protein